MHTAARPRILFEDGMELARGLSRKLILKHK